MPVPGWARLLRCTECGARDADFVVSGTALVVKFTAAGTRRRSATGFV